MCIAFWLLDQHPAFWLILAQNRDEYLSRPTLAAHFWEDEGESILGGRDLRSGGTWMGVTKSGRLAFITNVRYNSPDKERSGLRSRGDLPFRFFKSDKTPLEYVEEIAREAGNYNGFNLVVADLKQRKMAFLSNRHGEGKYAGQEVSPGLHSLSNGTLDACWQKMERGKKLLEAVVADSSASDVNNIPCEQIIEKVLCDDKLAADCSAQRAETHYSDEFERHLSPIFVNTVLFDQPYGTRSMAVVGIRRDGTVFFFERYLEGNEWKDHSFEFQVEGRTPV